MLFSAMEHEIDKTLKAKHLAAGPREVRGIILHDTAGSGTHNDTKYLANPGDGRKVSVDFTVERDGSIYQLNPDLKKFWTYHAGRATQFKGLRNQAVTKGCIGIEIVQKANMSLTPLYPDAQVNAVARLCAYLVKEFALKREDITTHQKVITDGSRSDPRKFPWTEFWAIYDTFAGGGIVTHIVEAGDTLWKLANRYSTRVETIKALNDMNAASNLIEIGQRLRVK